jgi:hypothetical protein
MTHEQLAIGPAARYLGKSVETLRRWELEGRLIPEARNARGQRLYGRGQLEDCIGGTVHPKNGGRIRDSLVGVSTRNQLPEQDPPVDPILSDLWNQTRCYILRATSEHIRDREDSPWFDSDQPWRYVWTPESSDRCAEICERRVRRYLIPGVTGADLHRIVDRTVRHFVEDEIDRRLRAELTAQGSDAAEWD